MDDGVMLLDDTTGEGHAILIWVLFIDLSRNV